MVVLNEKKYAEYVLKSGDVGEKPTATLVLLGKYYRKILGYKEKETYDALNEFMIMNYKRYNPDLWEDVIESISKKSAKYHIRQIDHINITQDELDTIQSVHNAKKERLLFVILCHAKLHNKDFEHNNNWSNIDVSELYRSARVSVKNKDDKFYILGELLKMKLISIPLKNENINFRCEFVNNNSEVAMQIRDFRELGYEYLNYLGQGDFIRCQECGILVRKTNKNDHSTKYCRECAKSVKKAQNVEYYQSKK